MTQQETVVRCWQCRSDIPVVTNTTNAEDAIQRVRKLVRDWIPEYDVYGTFFGRQVLAALDGDGDDKSS
jgi:hypothetical protein